jgi:hypothetical protein
MITFRTLRQQRSSAATVLAIAALTAVALVIFISVLLLMGWTLAHLWTAALVPQGLKPMDMYQGTALLLLVQMLRGTLSYKPRTPKVTINNATEVRRSGRA